MKRDLDLIREIMLVLEDKMEYDEDFTSDRLYEIMQNEILTHAKLFYHIELLAEGNFIKIEEYKYMGGRDFIVNTITSEGQDFLDTIRQKKTWDIVKGKASEIGGSSISLIVEIGKDYLKKQIGI